MKRARWFGRQGWAAGTAGETEGRQHKLRHGQQRGERDERQVRRVAGAFSTRLSLARSRSNGLVPGTTMWVRIAAAVPSGRDSL